MPLKIFTYDDEINLNFGKKFNRMGEDSVSQTMGRDLKVGRQGYANGSRRLVNYRTKEKDLRAQNLKSKKPS